MTGKTVSRRDKDVTRAKLIRAVGTILSKKGFTRIGVNAVALEAGVDKVLIYRYFDGLPGLIGTFGREGDFWPDVQELAGGRMDTFLAMDLPERLNRFAGNFTESLKKRPVTLEIMAWEMVERNELTVTLENIREKSFLEMRELFFPEITDQTALSDVISLVGAGLSYLVTRARWIRWYGGIDLTAESGWDRIQDAVELIVSRVASEHNSSKGVEK